LRSNRAGAGLNSLAAAADKAAAATANKDEAGKTNFFCNTL
jgi:hypothetical protein